MRSFDRSWGTLKRWALLLLLGTVLCSTGNLVEAKRSSAPSPVAKRTAAKSTPSQAPKPRAAPSKLQSKATRTPLAPKTGKYCHLKDGSCVAPSRPFTARQKANIIRENKRQNNGRVRDDVTGRFLAKPQRLKKGVTPSPNEYQVDHIKPRKPANPNVAPGSNSYSNAQVISRQANRKKSNKTNP